MTEIPETPLPGPGDVPPDFGRVFAPPCQMYGCDKEMRPSTHVLLMIEDEEVDLFVCAYHADILTNWDPKLYDIGFTFRHDVELRLIPAQPAEPTPEDPPTE